MYILKCNTKRKPALVAFFTMDNGKNILSAYIHIYIPRPILITTQKRTPVEEQKNSKEMFRTNDAAAAAAAEKKKEVEEERKKNCIYTIILR